MSVSKLIEENSEKLSAFNEEYDRVFTDIICYIRLNTRESIETEEVISDLIDIFLDNQKQGVPVNNVINGDYKVYCKDIVSTLNNGNTQKILGTEHLPLILSESLLILILINLPSYIIKSVKTKEIMPFSITLDLLIQFALIPIFVIFIFNYMSKNLSFDSVKNRKKDIKEFFVIFLIMILLIGIPVVLHIFKWNILLFNINIFILASLIVILAAITFLKIKK